MGPTLICSISRLSFSIVIGRSGMPQTISCQRPNSSDTRVLRKTCAFRNALVTLVETVPMMKPVVMLFLWIIIRSAYSRSGSPTGRLFFLSTPVPCVEMPAGSRSFSSRSSRPSAA